MLDAVADTARHYGLEWELFDDFLTSMRMDLTVTDYQPDRAALDRYMYGSAEVIGLQPLPVLGTVVPAKRRAARRGTGKSVPAHQLPARYRRGPDARPGVPARRRTRPATGWIATC